MQKETDDKVAVTLIDEAQQERDRFRGPRQAGYVFQTPEMHRLHHQSGHHAYNYSDIVWWDMLFGTYCNPQHGIKRCGFDAHSERQIIPMLLGWDHRACTRLCR